ncbi:MAG: Tol-Pal system beta propeller repeat protein TolB [Methylococcales symbiont of Iophon sp. n. MRB-2018]|nr:MAG: Tol-Pal system beta propeller repeat protein TolB [Methylococcales symbiont of Iophon sp. n. MRB-2018]KAF3980189.1 MAG: Tol-Pal system beta propeller repeat protein TolB [Methylococcales symbiont of Iophon sp. n. MRB-2018]
MPILFRKILFISFLVLYPAFSRAELVIEITRGVEKAVPIAIVPFGWQGNTLHAPINLVAVIKANLSRSGVFKPLAETDMLAQPTDAKKVRYRNWQALGQDYLVIGQVSEVAGRYRIQFQLFDVYKREEILSYRLLVAEQELRRSAHHISDLVYEKLTGKKGVFSTHLAYITSTSVESNKKRYKLLVADVDGFNPKTIVSSFEPLMSPTWSPDGKQIAYVAFENRHSVIFIHTLATGKKLKVASFKGINGAPAFSPDGKRLAMTLSKDGSPDIYVLNLASGDLLKVTKSYGIDTEATWSPDGQFIVYTSNRGGKPQLYKISSRGGGSPRRITFDGDYNARGQLSADGKSLAMVHANRGDYRIAVMDMATGLMNVLTAGRFDESPSFSPNGDMILFASKNSARKGVLTAVSIDGRMQQNMGFDSGDVREPAWSP